ncbi:MAG: LVIVD repeat-containing protein, partial [Chitinophagales bacterium]
MKFFSRILWLAIFELTFLKMQAQLCGNDTLTLQQKWEYGTGFSLPIHVTINSLNPSYIFAAAQSGGLMIFDVSNPNAASLTGTIPISSFDNLYVMSCEENLNYLYVALGNYFGTNPQKSGMAIVDVTDPLNPVITNQWENSTVVKGAAIVKVQGNYAYLGAMTDGLIILDVSDKSNIQFVSKFIPDPNWPVPNPIPSATPNARGMQIIGNIIYLCYDAGGLRIINIADKLNPKETGRYINQSALNKQQAYNNIVVHDDLAYIGVDYCGMEIVNISDTSNITQTGWWNPWDCTSPNNFWIGSHGHGNEVTYDDQQKVVFMSAGASDLRIIDVSDPSNPDSCGGFGTFTDTLGAYAATVSGNKIFLSYIFTLIPYVSVWSG